MKKTAKAIAKDMGDSGIFGDKRTMRTVPNSLAKAPKVNMILKGSSGPSTSSGPKLQPASTGGYGNQLQPAGKVIQGNNPNGMQLQGSFKKGGKVKKTGAYKLHKGEKVLNAKQTKKEESAKHEKTESKKVEKKEDKKPKKRTRMTFEKARKAHFKL